MLFGSKIEQTAHTMQLPKCPFPELELATALRFLEPIRIIVLQFCRQIL